MKHILAGLAILTLAACNGSTKVAEAGDGTSICPPSEVISDVATYRNDQTEAQEDYAAWHAANGKRAGVTQRPQAFNTKLLKKVLPTVPRLRQPMWLKSIIKVFSSMVRSLTVLMPEMKPLSFRLTASSKAGQKVLAL